MLPSVAAYHYLWEISTGEVPGGATVRTFGRLSSYNMVQSEATLTAQHSSTLQQLRVSTKFVEPFIARLGSYFLALGELERDEGALPVLHARLLTCIDGVDFSRLQQAVEEQRRYFKEREAAGS
ncbi:CST complex subunit TEN1 [Bombina bombina]|uniref:CST complex subunit TEN1 n=1 Tax=Bombina bombina TaxID=8345 RepID=UPI00235A8DA8|nr:CST complex subunit TEN1 [Bombina bombina]